VVQAVVGRAGLPKPTVVLAGDNTGPSVWHTTQSTTAGPSTFVLHGITSGRWWAEGDVILEYVPTALQNADFLTKPLCTKAHRANAAGLGLTQEVAKES